MSLPAAAHIIHPQFKFKALPFQLPIIQLTIFISNSNASLCPQPLPPYNSQLNIATRAHTILHHQNPSRDLPWQHLTQPPLHPSVTTPSNQNFTAIPSPCLCPQSSMAEINPIKTQSSPNSKSQNHHLTSCAPCHLCSITVHQPNFRTQTTMASSKSSLQSPAQILIHQTINQNSCCSPPSREVLLTKPLPAPLPSHHYTQPVAAMLLVSSPPLQFSRATKPAGKKQPPVLQLKKRR